MLRPGPEHSEQTLPGSGKARLAAPQLLLSFLGEEGSSQGKAKFSTWQRQPPEHNSTAPRAETKRDGLNLQPAESSGSSGGYRDPSSAPFTAVGCGANDLAAWVLASSAIKIGMIIIIILILGNVLWGLNELI